MTTHFDAYIDPEDMPDRAWCGVKMGDYSDASGNWKLVDCKRCLTMRIRFDENVRKIEEHIIKQMGEMSDYFNQQEEK